MKTKISIAHLMCALTLLLLLLSKASQASITGCNPKYTAIATDAARGITNTIVGQNSMPLTPSCAFVNGFDNPACRSNFMFTDYVGSTINVTMYTTIGGFYVDGGLPMGVTVYNWQCYHNGIMIEDGSGDATNPFGTTLNNYPFTFSSPGTYEIRVDYNDPGPAPLVTNDFSIIFVIMPKITSAWIEADAICENWAPPAAWGDKYNFKIKTTPDISAVMNSHPNYIVVNSAGTCVSRDAISIGLDITVSNPTLLGLSPTYGLEATGNFNGTFIYNKYRSSLWPSLYSDPYTFSVPYSTPPYGIYYGVLTDFLNPPVGMNYGQPLDIKVKLTDNVEYTDATPYNLSAPLPIKRKIKDINVDINTICAPGSSTPAVVPQYSVSFTGGVAPFTYSWSAMGGNDVIIDNASISNPSVTGLQFHPPGVIGSKEANYILTISDALNCGGQKNVKTRFITSGSDLASRDSYSDMYEEPNLQLYVTGDGNIWSSPDIWNRYNDDGGLTNQPPLFVPDPTWPAMGLPNYLYTRIRNVGCTTSPTYVAGTPVHLNSYWTLGGFGGAEVWPGAWTTNMIPGTSGTVPQGYQIDFLNPIPALAPGTSTIIKRAWGPPNPAAYSTTYSTAVTGSPDQMSLCFLSRIVDFHETANLPIGMTFPEISGPDVKTNINNNNNIATMNTSVMRVSAFPRPRRYILFVGNVGSFTSTFSVSVRNEFTVLQGPSPSRLHDFVNVKVYLGDLFDKWVNAGSHGQYMSMNMNEKSVVFDGSSLLKLDSLTLDSGALYSVVLEPTLVSGANGAMMPDEKIYFSQMDANGEVVGGYSYSIEYDDKPAAKGVLAVTEISRGPSTDPGCQYVELIVGNCGADGSQYVDVDKWIIDDNSGNFDDKGCDEGVGITNGYYRLSGAVWQNVPVGTRIVLYNADNNCYNLPTDFTADNEKGIYWVPVPATLPRDYVLEGHYNSSEKVNCNYCNEEKPEETEYTGAYDWMNTIGMDDANDAIQVRCPGCTETDGTAAFYHGIGYGASTSNMVKVDPGSSSLGGHVIYDQPKEKIEFTGSSLDQMFDDNYWVVSSGDDAGATPLTLGLVNNNLYYAVYTHAFGMPCCGGVEPKERRAGSVEAQATKSKKQLTETKATKSEGISVYPNPATSTLFVKFPKAKQCTIKLLNMVGQVKDEQTIVNAEKATFNLKNYTPGLYIYQIAIDGKVESGKVLITE